MEFLTIIALVSLAVTSIICFFSFMFIGGDDDSFPIITICLSSLALVIEIIYLIVRFVKFVWFL